MGNDAYAQAASSRALSEATPPSPAAPLTEIVHALTECTANNSGLARKIREVLFDGRTCEATEGKIADGPCNMADEIRSILDASKRMNGVLADILNMLGI